MRKFLRALYSPDAEKRFGAVLALADHAEGLWAENPEKVREILRRLAWSLNEESGATGWGAPEAMGEIMARIPELQSEFAARYPGYLVHAETFLDNEVLDTGALWAIGRLGSECSSCTPVVERELARFLLSESASVRGAAAWAVGQLGMSGLEAGLSFLAEDPGNLVLIVAGEVVEREVGELAREALELVRAPSE